MFNILFFNVQHLFYLDYIHLSMQKVIIGGVPEHFNYPWHKAVKEGLFKAAHIDLAWQDYSTGTGAMCEDLNKGNLDMAVILTEGAINALCNGSDFKILKTFVESPLNWGIHVPPNSSLTTEQDIQDKTYAISRYGSGSHLMAYVDARIRGWDTSKLKFEVVGNMPGAIKSFQNGESEIFFWERYTTKPFVEQGKFKFIGIRPTPWSCFVLVASANFIKNHSNITQRLMTIISESARQVKENSLQSIQEISEFYNLRQADVSEWFKETDWNYENKININQLNDINQLLVDLKLVDRKLEIHKILSPFTKGL